MEKNYKVTITVTDTEKENTVSMSSYSDDIYKMSNLGVSLETILSQCISEVKILDAPSMLTDDKIDFSELKLLCQTNIDMMSRDLEPVDSSFDSLIGNIVTRTFFGQEGLDWLNQKTKGIENKIKIKK
jgi:hypothetical protein